ncbi:MAG: ThuA domain-containing protein [Chloroflexia bacterium]|nr:ThuA domain-containing protein [Chloroflexia bacterium]
MSHPVRVTVWNEYRHEKENEQIGSIYPNGIHGAIAEGLNAAGGFEVRTATLDEPEHGLTEDVIANTDVFVWWGHKAHADVSDEVVAKVHKRVLDGAGLIVLHSGHFSKIFKRLMGTTCDLKWREADEKERLWVVSPGHPIVEGVGEYIELAEEEMYGEPFGIPQPDNLIFVSWFQGGEVFRSGGAYYRGAGKVFYFRPGHETYPTYFNEEIRRVIANAASWAAPVDRPPGITGNQDPIEDLPWYDKKHAVTEAFGDASLT